MFVKLTRSGSRRYVQLVESCRDEAGKPRQRTVATVGRLDETGGAVDSLLSGLLRATGRQVREAPDPSSTPVGIRFESSLVGADSNLSHRAAPILSRPCKTLVTRMDTSFPG